MGTLAAVNLILVEPEDFVASDRVRLEGRRLEHVRQVCRAGVGESLRIGELGGKVGSGRILRLDDKALEIEVRLDRAPPAPLPVTLVLALPRPPALRRVLQQATAMGVKRLLLLHSRRVEKSYWQSSGLDESAVDAQLRLGLEQARDTILPVVETRRRFRPFAEDELPLLAHAGPVLLADPGAGPGDLASGEGGHVTLIVGPEGGFIPFELELLTSHGAQLIGLGERVLRVETAVVALLARLAL
jgi:RsmE family RNA methyltransferase